VLPDVSEEVWEQDQSDPKFGEFLALAYLNTEDRRVLPKLEKQAYAIIRGLVTSGARVTFLVQHSHEKLGWLQGRELNQYCSGRLSLAGGHVVFVSDKGDKASQHSFDRDAGKIKSISLNADDTRGTFVLKLASEGNLFMATRNRNREEARVIVDLMQQMSRAN